MSPEIGRDISSFYQKVIMKNLLSFLQYILSVIAGYIVMVLGLFLAQDLTLGRPEVGITPFYIIFFVGIGSVLAAVAGGWVAGLIKRQKQLWPQQIMCVLLIIESTYLMMNDILTNPIWFEMLASASLLFGVLMGGWIANYGWAMPRRSRV